MHMITYWKLNSRSNVHMYNRMYKVFIQMTLKENKIDWEKENLSI